jgi:type I restriction enzyme, S subunit
LEGANITQSSVRIRPLPPVDVDFFVRALQSPQLVEQMSLRQFGNAIQRLNVDHVRNLAVPLPPSHEWEVMHIMIEAAMKAANHVSVQVWQALSDLKELDQVVLAKAFRGDLAPPDPSDEPATLLLDRIRAERSMPNGKVPGRTRQRRLNGLD